MLDVCYCVKTLWQSAFLFPGNWYIHCCFLFSFLSFNLSAFPRKWAYIQFQTGDLPLLGSCLCCYFYGIGPSPKKYCDYLSAETVLYIDSVKCSIRKIPHRKPCLLESLWFYYFWMRKNNNQNRKCVPRSTVTIYVKNV